MLETNKVIKAPSNVKDGDIVNDKVVKLAVDKEYRTILSTLGLLLKSTRFQAIFWYTAAGIIVYAVPQLAPARAFINQGVYLVMAFVLGKSVEDAVTAWNNGGNTPPPEAADIDSKIPEIAKSIWDLFNQNLLNAETPAENPPVDTTNKSSTPVTTGSTPATG